MDESIGGVKSGLRTDTTTLTALLTHSPFNNDKKSGDKPYYAIWFPEKANQLKNLGLRQDFLFMDHLRLCYKSTDYAALH
ncbi:hypothetical protein [Spirosoma endbachense]|uniref:Uncharacterized protein n=1 Tax=Spirosoma endbachense TaxID=2666025 RepID=A0A6P1VY99_9BACT|nr:hypothetical protein [Spirosoma endbachense]QHV97745.1 hypothetical protein GJR95_23260 [Spirosoma endbachense]